MRTGVVLPSIAGGVLALMIGGGWSLLSQNNSPAAEAAVSSSVARAAQAIAAKRELARAEVAVREAKALSAQDERERIVIEYKSQVNEGQRQINEGLQGFAALSAQAAHNPRLRSSGDFAARMAEPLLRINSGAEMLSRAEAPASLASFQKGVSGVAQEVKDFAQDEAEGIDHFGRGDASMGNAYLDRASSGLAKTRPHLATLSQRLAALPEAR